VDILAKYVEKLVRRDVERPRPDAGPDAPAEVTH
jgi:hypothetical protein